MPGQADDSKAEGRLPEGAGSRLFITGDPRPAAFLWRPAGASAAANDVDGSGGFGYLGAYARTGASIGTSCISSACCCCQRW